MRPTAYTILGNVEDPQNRIAQTLATVLTAQLQDSVQVVYGIGSRANLDSLERGAADFGIIDNHARFSDNVSAVLPLYSQVLHVLHKKDVQPRSLLELLHNKKVFSGVEGSGTRQFVDDLMNDLGIHPHERRFVDVYNFFEADVIFAFTDLLTDDELRDLGDYTLYSLDDVAQLGAGSFAESICTRHPQFEPFVIPEGLYGTFTKQPVLTLKVDALLACRADLDPAIVFRVCRVLSTHTEELKKINPLLYRLTPDFDSRKLSFGVHPGAQQFLERNEPSFFERYAELFGVLITFFVALASGGYSIAQWQRQRKKNKVDVYYQRITDIQSRTRESTNEVDLRQLEAELRATLEETIHLVTREKLLADESYLIFLHLASVARQEIHERLDRMVRSGVSNAPS